jgi:[ribosomal protein S5]-alanine N-acetyltransferase
VCSFPVLNIGDYILRAWRLDDAEALYKLRSDPEVDRFLDYYPEDIDEAREWIAEAIDKSQKRAELHWAIASKDTDSVVGTCRFFRWSPTFCRAEIAYTLAHAYWNQGIMTRAIRAIVHYGFSHMALNRIQATVAVGNKASQRVLEKVGFQCEGVLKEHVVIHGQFADSKLYALLKKWWS